MKIKKFVFENLLKTKIDFKKFSKKLTLIGFESIVCDDYLDINIPYNRRDCNNVISIIKELCRFDDSYNLNYSVSLNKCIKENISIIIQDKKFCPIYSLAIIKSINLECELPKYIEDTLSINGITLKIPILNILNYVTLITGQPFHVYNLDYIKKTIILKKCANDFLFKTITGWETIIKKGTFIIESDKNIISIPGIIGSHETKIHKTTSNILIECAFFLKDTITCFSNMNNIITDSSERFSCGIDVSKVCYSLNYAIDLIINIFNGELKYKNYFLYNSKFPKNKLFSLSKTHIFLYTNINVFNINIVKIFNKLKFIVKNFKTKINIYIPFFRTDINTKEDIYSEILKLYGYNNILTHSKSFLHEKKLNSNNLTFTILLKNLGFNEIISYSFVDMKKELFFNINKNFIELSNPLSECLNILRPTLKQGLLNAISFNLNRQNCDLKLFEIGNVYFYSKKNNFCTAEIISIAITNKNEVNAKNFTILKKIIEQIILSVYDYSDIIFIDNCNNFFIDNMNTKIILNNKEIGELGCLKTSVLEKFSIKQNVYIASLTLNIQNTNKIKIFKEMSIYPGSIRDLSIIIENNINYFCIINFIRKMNIRDLEKISFLDCFYFKDLYKKSLTLRFNFKSNVKTLLDENITEYMKLIQDGLKKKFFCEIREQ